MKKVLAVTLLASVFSAPVFAEDSGFYVGANLGQAKASGNLVDGLTTSHSDTSFSLLGGYQYNKHLAVEAQYIDMGELSQGGATAKTSGVAVAAVGILPISKKFSAYGKLGVSNTGVKVTNPVISQTDKKTAVTFGLGAQFNVNNSFGIRAGLDRYSVGKTGNLGTDGTYEVVYAGVLFKL